MIKFVMSLRRHQNMNREQSQDYWSNKHGPFFMKNAATIRRKTLTIDIPLNDGLRSSIGMIQEYGEVIVFALSRMCTI
jgi:hypothetical protein